MISHIDEIHRVPYKFGLYEGAHPVSLILRPQPLFNLTSILICKGLTFSSKLFLAVKFDSKNDKLFVILNSFFLTFLPTLFSHIDRITLSQQKSAFLHNRSGRNCKEFKESIDRLHSILGAS